MQFRLTPINREAQQDRVIPSNTNRSNSWLSQVIIRIHGLRRTPLLVHDVGL